jgi:hypothetical protein
MRLMNYAGRLAFGVVIALAALYSRERVQGGGHPNTTAASPAARLGRAPQAPAPAPARQAPAARA